METILDAWFVLTISIAAWMNREQSKALEYLLAENKTLKEQLKLRGGRLRFTDKQRCLPAAKAKELGRAALKKVDTIVCPDTLLRRHRQHIAGGGAPWPGKSSASRGLQRDRRRRLCCAMDGQLHLQGAERASAVFLDTTGYSLFLSPRRRSHSHARAATV